MKHSFFQYLLIIIFAAGVVALGVDEIHQRYVSDGFDTGLPLRSQNLRSEDSTRMDRERGLADRFQQPTVKREDTSQREDESEEVSRERASARFPFFSERGSSSGSPREEIGRSDRKELQDLIDKAVEE